MLLVLALACGTAAQTFEVTGQAPAPQQKKGQKKSAAPAGGQSSLSWGTSIDLARKTRAAEAELKRGNYTNAANMAQQAANAAPQNAKLWFLAGYTARLAGRHGQSLDFYQRGLRAEPSSLEGLSGLAQTYARMGRFNEAMNILQKLIARDPKRSNELLIAGELALQSGEYQQAIALLQRAEKIKPSARGELLMASSYVKLKQPEKARQLLANALKREPNNPQILRATAGFYRETKEYPKAIAVLKRIAGNKPELLAELAFTYELAKDPTNTAVYYAKAADAGPKNIAYQLSAAQSLVRVSEYDKADSYLDRARAIDPDHYRLHGTLAEIARQENRTNDAINEYRLALANLPESVPEGPLYSVQVRVNLGELLRDAGDEAGQKEQATIAFNRINSLNVEPVQRFDYHRLRGTIQFVLGDYAASEADAKQAIALQPDNPNIYLQYGQLLWRTNRVNDAQASYAKALALDPKNRFALSSLGFLAREMRQPKDAERYFMQLAQFYPNEFTAYLALGDLYTAQRTFDPALQNYEKAYSLNKRHPMIIAGGANAGIESKKFELAKAWLDRADERANEHPFVMRERERYLTWTGNYLESAKLGYKVIEKLPRDRDAVVYLGYDLLYLGRYDDLLQLTSKYESILSKEAALPLLTGYVHRKSELLDEAERAFSRAIERDPKVTTAYINRGFVYNDLQNPEMATKDFQSALKLEPNNGEASLGMSFSYLQLRKPQLALEQVENAAKILGESKSTHLARAGSYRQKLLLAQAEREYRKAMEFDPNSDELNIALAQVLFGQRRYEDAISAYQRILPLVEDPSSIYANMASAAARLKRDADALAYVAAAEKSGGDQAAVLLATGDTLLDLGHEEQAMDRYVAALSAPDSSRVDVRLAFARNFMARNKWEDARQQVGLAFAESRVGESVPVLPEHLVTAANIFARMYDFDLAVRYFEMARDAGADDRPVSIGLANTYLAQGRTDKAELALKNIGGYAENAHDFDYLMAYGTLNRQRRANPEAILGFARAHDIEATDDRAERAMLDATAEEGRPIGRGLSLSSDFRYNGIFEDATVYQLDAAQFGVSDGPLAPAPRSSHELIARTDYRFRLGPVPLLGTYEFRNARGETSFPSESVILDRNTVDNAFAFGGNPSIRFGNTRLYLNPSIQFTIRRDRNVPFEVDQNLFKQQLYFATSSLLNWITVRGYGIHESGSFQQRSVTSRDLVGRLEFEVGRPWGKNAMITGYSTRVLKLDPIIREYFTTSTYVGYERKFTRDLRAKVIGEYIRSWRVLDRFYDVAQAMRPAFELDYRRNRWGFEGSFAYTRGQGFHLYDNFQSGVLVSYTKPWRRTTFDGVGEVGIEYPLKFAFGVQQQSFLNYTGERKSAWVPVVRINLF